MQERSVALNLEPEAEPTTEDEVFYNTEMVTNRDISTACLAVFHDERDEPLQVCDALAASGIRGLRYLDEVDGIEHLLLNDINPNATQLIETHRDLNDVDRDRVAVTTQDANLTLTEHRRTLDVVDIDPFGSPAPYLDSAARAVTYDGAIGVTATDLGPLYGSYPKVCRRRYGSKPSKNKFGHEIGLRIFLKHAFNTHARYDYAVEPRCCHYERHYHRIFATVRESKKVCNRRMEYIGFLDWCPGCRWRGYAALDEGRDTCPHCDHDTRRAGPLWTGPFADADFMADVTDWLDEAGYKDAERLAATVRDECEIRTPFYHVHEVASAAELPVPSRDALLDALQEQGYRATRTHFSPEGVRTDAPIGTLHDVLAALADQ